MLINCTSSHKAKKTTFTNMKQVNNIYGNKYGSSYDNNK